MLQIADLVSDAPARKDVVVGALGASSALAGLILVFLGIVISAYQEYPPETPQDALTRHKRAVAGILLAFFLGLMGASLSLLWLITDGACGLYQALIVTFFVQLVLILAIALYTTYGVLLNSWD